MADKDEVQVEVPPGPLGADPRPKVPESKEDLKEVLINPKDAELHPAPGDDALEAERGAQTNPDRPPFASSGPAELLTGLAAGPGESHAPDPDKFDAEGRLKDLHDRVDDEGRLKDDSGSSSSKPAASPAASPASRVGARAGDDK